MKLIDYLKSKLIGKDEVSVTRSDIDSYSANHEKMKFFITEIALFTSIDLIAKTVAKCEFVTAHSHEEHQGSEYYAWNIAPNKHQSKDEFIAEFVRKLLFYNEALIIETADGQRLVADSFSKKEYALREDIFTNVRARGFAFKKDFMSSEVIYLKHSDVGVIGILAQMCKSYETIMNYAEKRYKKSMGHKGFLNIDTFAQNDPNFQKNFDELMNKRFREYFNAQDAVLTLYDGFHYTEPSTEISRSTLTEVGDIQKLKDEAFETVGNALHIPQALIRGEASQLKDAVDSFIGNAIEIITRPLAEMITDRCFGYNEYQKGNYLIIDTTAAKHIDAISSAVNIEKAISSRIITPAKVQKYCNMLPSNDESANTYYVTKNLQTAAEAVAEKGGENN